LDAGLSSLRNVLTLVSSISNVFITSFTIYLSCSNLLLLSSSSFSYTPKKMTLFIVITFFLLHEQLRVPSSDLCHAKMTPLFSHELTSSPSSSLQLSSWPLPPSSTTSSVLCSPPRRCETNVQCSSIIFNCLRPCIVRTSQSTNTTSLEL